MQLFRRVLMLFVLVFSACGLFGRQARKTGKPIFEKKAPVQIQEQRDSKTTTPQGDMSFKVRPWTEANLTRHWEKHKAEFPEYKSETEYRDGTLEFFRNPPKGTLFKTNTDKDQLYFDPKTNTFGVTTSKGVPKTCFRPTAGIKYWNRQ